jgi:hypothetical protein
MVNTGRGQRVPVQMGKSSLLRMKAVLGKRKERALSIAPFIHANYSSSGSSLIQMQMVQLAEGSIRKYPTALLAFFSTQAVMHLEETG